MPNSTSNPTQTSIASKTRQFDSVQRTNNNYEEASCHEWPHTSLPMMKFIFASLASFFLSATFSGSASCFHVSAAEIHTPISATIVNGLAVRAAERGAIISDLPAEQTRNTTSPAEI